MQKRYAKPPIAEAVIELQTRWYSENGIDALARFRDSIADRFPVVSPIASMSLTVSKPGEAPEYSSQQTGFRLATADNSRALQLQEHGFAYSQLSNYTCWEDFSGEAFDLWKQYVERCQPESVVRISTRFINKIVVPEDQFDLKDYFNLYPTFPEDVNETITGVFMQLRQPLPTVLGAVGTINFSNAVENAGTTAAHSAFVLDFDLALEGAWAPSEAKAWEVLTEFRRVKNQYFESAITDKSRSLFQ